MPEHLRAAVLLAGFTGLRVAEASGLRVADVDFKRRIVNPVVQHLADPLKSEGARTDIPIPASLSAELRRARATVDGLRDGFRYHDLRHWTP
jgi:integrase